MTRVPTWVGGLVGVGVIVAVWWLASATLFTASGSIPAPPEVVALFGASDEWATTLSNLSGTLASAGWGYLWGNLAAVALATLVLLVPVLEPVATQMAIVTYCLPLVAIGPILVIVAGREAPQGASIALAALSVFFTTVVGALLGLRAAPQTSLDVVAAYGGSRFTALRKVQLIAALPSLFAALKIAAPAAFLGAVLAEYLGSGGDRSLGRALIAAQTNSDAPRLWYLALVSGAAAGLAYAVVGLVAKAVTPWSSGTPGRFPPVSAATIAAAPLTDTLSNRTVAAAVLRRVGMSLVVVVSALVVLAILWIVLLRVFDVSTFVGKTPVDVFHYLFTEAPARGIRPASLRAADARAQLGGAWLVTLGNAAIGFVTGLVAAMVIAALFVLVRPFEFAFMPIAMLLRSVPLVAMAPVLLLIFGQGKLGIATIGAIVVLFPALVNIVLGLRSASPLALDLVRVNGGSALTELWMVRVPSALPALFASIRISVPGAIVGAMLAEWLSGFTGLGGILSDYKGRGNFGGVWAIVVVSVVTSIVGYAVAAIVESAALAAWGPDAGKR